MTAVSFDVIVYGRWLSNVSFSIPLVALFFFSLIKLVKTKNPKYWLAIGIFGGLLSQFELLHLLYAFITIIIAIKIFSLPIKNRYFLFGLGLAIIINANFILFDARHQFLLTNAVLHYLTSQSLSVDPLKVIYTYIDGLTLNMVATLFPSNGMLLFLFITAMLMFYFKKKTKKMSIEFKLILLMIFFSFPYIFLLKYGSLEHFYAGTAIGWIVGFNFLVSNTEKSLTKYGVVLAYCLIVVGNISYTNKSLPNNSHVFYHAVQQNYMYKDQLATLDYVFSHGGNGFTIESYNIPNFHQHAWQYLYDWYGKQKYPKQYANNATPGEKETVFMIIEPGAEGKIFIQWLATYHKVTTPVRKQTIGGIEIQQRKRLITDQQ